MLAIHQGDIVQKCFFSAILIRCACTFIVGLVCWSFIQINWSSSDQCLFFCPDTGTITVIPLGAVDRRSKRLFANEVQKIRRPRKIISGVGSCALRLQRKSLSFVRKLPLKSQGDGQLSRLGCWSPWCMARLRLHIYSSFHKCYPSCEYLDVISWFFVLLYYVNYDSL